MGSIRIGQSVQVVADVCANAAISGIGRFCFWVISGNMDYGIQ